jgi:hypothetical protein
MGQDHNVEDDGFITVVGFTRKPHVPVDQRCADCHQPIAHDGSGHVTWCPFFGEATCLRLLTCIRHPATSIGE